MRWPAVFAAVAALAGCDDGLANGPFDSLPLDGDFKVGLATPAHVARDQYGIAHISAATLADAAFVQGYVMAHDRLPQMDILRRLGAGRLAELYGATDPSVIDSDLEMRMHRMTPLAEQTWAALQSSRAPTDLQVVALLQRFADGVNAYAAALADGDWALDPELAASFSPSAFAAWSPIDSLVVLRFESLAASWTVPFELAATDLYQKLRATFDNAPVGNPAAVARRGISRDLLRLTPVGTDPTIPGFPNVAVDTGSRSDGSDPAAPASRGAAAAATATAAAPGRRPEVPQAVLDAARDLFAADSFGHPYAGSNSWAVGADLAGGGHVLLATDQHVQLTNPSLFYPTHLIIEHADIVDDSMDTGDTGSDGKLPADRVDLIGVTIPGIPGVMIGSNGNLAWATTVAEHDVNDVYLEQIAPCPDQPGDCAASTGAGGAPLAAPLQSFTEDIQIGALGAITGSVTATYEVVPQHGPILPTIDRTNHVLVPRSGPTAMSVRFTGYQPSFEIRALYNLARAGDVHAGLTALHDITYGGQNWTMIDDQQHFAWSTHALIPVRAAAAYAWDPLVRQDALAPFFVLPGDGSAEWLDGGLSPRVIPHAIDPAQGYLVTANADPVGATFDDLPLDQGAVDGQPLYVGVAYDAGLREDRITDLVQQAALAAGGVTLDDMARIQADTHSNVGAGLVPAIVTALDRLDSPAGVPGDLAPYVAALSADDRARLATARGLLAGWTFATPAAAAPNAPPDPDSAATALFNTWMHFFLTRTLGDELAAVGFDVSQLEDNQLVRIVHAMLTDPKSFVTSPATQQPILCADYPSAGNSAGPDTSCTVQILAALIDAMTELASPQGFGTADTAMWRWGALHRLTIAPLVPDPALDLPAPGDADAGGFPRDGDNFAVNRADRGWADLDFSRRADGAAQRMVAEARPGAAIAIRWALPGGTIFDHRSPHYRDLLDRYYLTDQLFDAPIAIADIAAAGETRWVFR